MVTNIVILSDKCTIKQYTNSTILKHHIGSNNKVAIIKAFTVRYGKAICIIPYTLSEYGLCQL